MVSDGIWESAEEAEEEAKKGESVKLLPRFFIPGVNTQKNASSTLFSPWKAKEAEEQSAH